MDQFACRHTMEPDKALSSASGCAFAQKSEHQTKG